MAEAVARDWSGTRLCGDGFVLRRWRHEDLDALVRHANDERVARGLSDRFPCPYRRVDGEAFLAGRAVDLAEPLFAIEVAGEAVGGIGARPGRGERQHGAEFGYWLGASHWGRGVMTRVVAVFAPWLMAELDLLRLQATVMDNNPASARVLLNNGFSEEGVQRSAVVKFGQVHDLRVFSRVLQRTASD